MQNKRRSLIFIIVFIVILFSLTIANIPILINVFRDVVDQKTLHLNQYFGKEIEESYRNSFAKRDKFIDLYGLVQKSINKKTIGNFEFIKDNQGFMHMFNSEIDTSNFNKDIIQLNNMLKERSIPLVYVQIPSRELENFNTYTSNYKVEESEKTIDSIVNSLKVNNIKYIDIRNDLKNNEYPKDDIFFRTDVHMKTGAEFWIMQKIIDVLENDYNIKFYGINQVLDIKNYTIINKKFLGNLGRSAGKYFTDLDDFQLYFPNFPTSLTLNNYSNGTEKSGEFWNTVMNGADINNNSIYWVTNYLQWPSPYYNIENKNVKDTNILIIMDSMGLRTASYLSLMVNNLTILDSRYFNGNDYINLALNEHNYDAVVVIQSTNLVNSIMFPKELQAEIVHENTPTNIDRNKKYTVNITVKNTSEEIWSEDKLIRLCIWQDGIDHGYRVIIPNGTEVKPGEEYTFILYDFQAPPSDTTYLEFQMLQEGRVYFGERQRVDIRVK